MTQAHMASAIFNRYHLSWIGLDARLGRKPSTTNYTDTGSLVAMGEKRKKKSRVISSPTVSRQMLSQPRSTLKDYPYM
jgi:hypothetical protein